MPEYNLCLELIKMDLHELKMSQARHAGPNLTKAPLHRSSPPFPPTLPTAAAHLHYTATLGPSSWHYFPCITPGSALAWTDSSVVLSPRQARTADKYLYFAF